MAITNPAIPSGSGDGGVAFARYIATIWRVIVIFGGIMVLINLLWGALDWIFAGNTPERINRAKDKMFNGLFGLAILILSYIIIKVVSSVTGLEILNPAWPTIK